MPRRGILRRVSTGVSVNFGRRGGRGGRIAATLFGGLFLAAGLVMTFLAGRALVRDLSPRGWDRVPCVITASSVDVVKDGYAFAGRAWRSARHQFAGFSSNVGVGEKRALVRRLRPGSVTIAYVNPADPAEAVQQRGLTWDYAFALIPLAFILFGVGIGFSSLVSWRRAGVRPLAASQIKRIHAKPQAAAGGEVEPDELPRVRRAQPKGGVFAFLIVFTIVWNLIVWKTSTFNLPGGFT